MLGGAVSVILVIALIAIAAFVFFFVSKSKITGKLLVVFIDRDKSLSFKLFKPNGRLFSFGKSRKDKDEVYMIDPDKVMLTKYPFGGIPSFLKQTVSCSIYAKGNPAPLDPSAVTELPKGKTSKEMAAIVSENVVRDIVKATRSSEKKEKIPAWLVSAVCVILVLVVLIMLFMMRSDISNMKSMIGGS